MIETRITGADLQAFAESLGPGMADGVARAVLRAGQEAAGELSEAVIDLLTKRPTGSLARSFEVAFYAGSTPRAEAVSRLPYAAIQDQGGPIRARRTKYLAIPLDGVPRGMRPREFGTPLAFVPSKRGGGVLVEKLANGRKGRARFALKKQVTITGVGYVRVAVDRLEELLPELTDHQLGIVVRAAEDAANG